MSANIPCPVCGSANPNGAETCNICDYAFGSGVVPESKSKCPRCGSEVVEGYAFCQVCGLDLRSRFPRPGTRNLSVRGLRDKKVPSGPHGFRGAPSGGAHAAGPGQAPAPAASAAPAGYHAPASQQPAAQPPAAQYQPQPQQVARPAAAAPHGHAPVGQAFGGHAPQGHAQPSPHATPGVGMRIVVVRRDGSEGEAYPLEPTTTDIGRNQGSIRFPNDQFVSPVHARLTIRADRTVELTDLNSVNGVFVRLGSVEAVYPGDSFLLGHHLLRLDNAPTATDPGPNAEGVRGFGTPLDPAWGRLTLLAVGAVASDHYDLRGSQVIFGRESGDILFPRDPYLSRQHARLRMELRGGNMSVMLEDLDSANGTFLRVRGQAVLRPGDTFRVGDQIFRVREN